MKKINVGIIGLGYWGPNLYRNFDSNNNINIIAVADLDKKKLKKFSQKNANLLTYLDYKKLILNPNVNAVAISTPVKTHYKIAKFALSHKKHVFVEKPLADSSLKCLELINISKLNKLSLFVDHTFLYTEAVNKIKSISSKNDFGNIMYYDSTRINLGLIQNDINVIWDLAVHDLSILDFIQKNNPISISAIGHKHIKTKPITSAYLTLIYKNNFIAHINVNWLSPVKIRQTILGGSKKMILYNDLEPSDKIKVFNKGVNVIIDEKTSNNLINYKLGDTYLPNLKNKEALSLAVDEFIKSIRNKRDPLTNGYRGYKIVKILECADESIRMNGKLVKINL
tara:strand:- start:537 stop:1553 length:1017 start_codon:yes stop_codon:yes gene_type:complete